VLHFTSLLIKQKTEKCTLGGEHFLSKIKEIKSVLLIKSHFMEAYGWGSGGIAPRNLDTRWR
jgi:hypothetical protein